MNMVIAGALSAFCPFDEKAWRQAMEELNALYIKEEA